MTKFGGATQVVEQRVFRWPATSPSQGFGSQHPQKFLRPPTCMHTVSEITTKFCVVIKLDVRKILHSRP